MGQAVAARLNPENKNPAFEGWDYVLAKEAVAGIAQLAFASICRIPAFLLHPHSEPWSIANTGVA